MKDVRKKDKKTLFYLYQAVEELTFEKIIEITSSKVAWDVFVTIFKGDERVKWIRLQKLRTKFEAIDMKESESAADYVSHTLIIVNQMKQNKKQLDNA